MKNKSLKNLSVSAMLLAVGFVLPFLTGQVPQIGNMLLPMHIPVLLCGLICGWYYGAAVGFILPLLRSLVFGLPLFYPAAIAMAFELCTYGLISGIIYACIKRKNILSVYISLISAMISGRIVWGAAQVLLLGLKGNAFSWAAFMSGAFINAVPGIIIQLILIPAIMIILDKTGIQSFEKKDGKHGTETR